MPRSFTGYFNFLYRRYFKTPPLCFAMQNIGEVARSDGGVKVLVRVIPKDDIVHLTSSPLPYPSITGNCVNSIEERS